MKDLLRFAFFSGCGLFLDVSLFVMLSNASVPVFFSSLASSLSAVTLIFLISNFYIFRNNTFCFRRYYFWLVYQLLNILFFSKMAEIIFMHGIAPILSKLATVPLSFSLNFFVARAILKDERKT